MEKHSAFRCRALAFVLLVATVFSLAVPAYAQEGPTLEQTLIESCESGKWVDISRYEIQPSRLEEIFYALMDAGKLPWNTSHYSYRNSGGLVRSFTPKYMDPEVYDPTAYALRAAEILDRVILEGMSDVQKALAVHDYLITHCVYDESLEKNTGYDLLVNESTVCAGYAQAYMDLMNRLGIECRYVVSEEMNHAWNIIKLDGSWYHVDLTWDDPTPDARGRVEHTYFLVTDAQMLELGDGHFGWETDVQCTDNRYANAFWRDVVSPIFFADVQTCYLRKESDYRGRIYRCDFSTGKLTRLHSNQEQYINVGKGKYAYTHGGLSLWNGRLYFSNMTTVWSMNLNGKDLRTEYTYSASKNHKFIYGIFVENDTLYLTLSDHGFNLTDAQVALQETGYHAHSYTLEQVAPTCLTEGKDVHSCGCGLTVEMKTDAATGHSIATFLAVSPQGGEMGTFRIGCGNCEYELAMELPACVYLGWLLEQCGSLFG